MSETLQRSDNLPLPKEFKEETLKVADEIVALLPDEESRKQARSLLSIFFLRSRYAGRYYPISSIDISKDVLESGSSDGENI